MLQTIYQVTVSAVSTDQNANVKPLIIASRTFDSYDEANRVAGTIAKDNDTVLLAIRHNGMYNAIIVDTRLLEQHEELLVPLRA